ncbi:patatin-like phospholipase family protein [Neisseriaceae bacterium JH1-16]|nr:patatin-like phospholipase family protein [Neisseriaceae bacterium JH1-16]
MHYLRIVIALVTAATLQACGTITRLDAVPAALVDRAAPPGIPNARYWLGSDITPFIKGVMADNQRELEARAKAGLITDPLPAIDLLAISGGGDNGAFGAGLLTGWTKHGDRPQFRVVTGISAGALIAPFAYLGSAYDSVLREVATSVGSDGVFRSRGLLAGLTSDGMADSTPLARLIAQYVTPAVLTAIAAEYAKGRALVIGTADLDSGRAVSWNMGAIATSGAPGALGLFRKVMLASASIPGAVPPVMIDVEVDGKRYQEMHVDGAVIHQVFTYPSNTIEALGQKLGQPYQRKIRIYAIRNSKLAPEWLATPRRTLSIGSRAISILLQWQGIGDLEYIDRTARKDGADFNLAYISTDFAPGAHQDFDPVYMNRLFDYAYGQGVKGYAWHKTLPTELPPR